MTLRRRVIASALGLAIVSGLGLGLAPASTAVESPCQLEKIPDITKIKAGMTPKQVSRFVAHVFADSPNDRKGPLAMTNAVNSYDSEMPTCSRAGVDIGWMLLITLRNGLVADRFWKDAPSVAGDVVNAGCALPLSGVEQIRAGMTPSQVKRSLGQPGIRFKYPDGWSGRRYEYVGSCAGVGIRPTATVSVWFVNGKVTKKSYYACRSASRQTRGWC